jgi:hypothetical protein
VGTDYDAFVQLTTLGLLLYVMNAFTLQSLTSLETGSWEAVNEITREIDEDTDEKSGERDDVTSPSKTLSDTFE